MKIVVGLGNPGKEYALNRHNLGFMALDHLLGDVSWQTDKRFNSLVYRDGGVLYLKPQSFMNNSGLSVRSALAYYQLLPKTLGLFDKKNRDLSDCLVVIQDDIDQDLGRYRWVNDSGSGGHNGIKSLIKDLKTQKFRRLKIGVANSQLRTNIPADRFVLANFSPEEKKIINNVLSQALQEL